MTLTIVLQLRKNTWVILYQNKDFGGLEILIPPKSDYILSNYDFGATIVSSFKVTDYLPVDGNSIAFWTTPNYHGESLTMTTSGSLNQGLIDFRPGSFDSWSKYLCLYS